MFFIYLVAIAIASFGFGTWVLRRATWPEAVRVVVAATSILVGLGSTLVFAYALFLAWLFSHGTPN